MIQFLFPDANTLRLSQNMCSRLCGDAILGPLKEVDLEGSEMVCIVVRIVVSRECVSA
jgi:hypothetical protein